MAHTRRTILRKALVLAALAFAPFFAHADFASTGKLFLVGGAAPASAPVNTVAPSVTGNQLPGQTLTCNTGTWTGSPAPTYTYQWAFGGVDIGGETSSTYVADSSHVEGNLTCTVTGTNASGSANATSANHTLWTPVGNISTFSYFASDAASTIHDTSGSVDTWDDQSGNGYNLTASTTARPTTGSVTINSRNAISFNGTTNTMSVNSAWYAIANGSNTACVTFKLASVTPNSRFIAATESASSRWYLLWLGTPTNQFWVLNSTSSTDQVTYSTSPGTTNPHILCLRRNGSSVAMIYDGVSVATGSNGHSENGVDAMRVGSNAAGAADFLNGSITDIFISTTSLSNADLNLYGTLQNYKYGVTWTGL